MSGLHPLTLLYVGWCAGVITAVIWLAVETWRVPRRRRCWLCHADPPGLTFTRLQPLHQDDNPDHRWQTVGYDGDHEHQQCERCSAVQCATCTGLTVADVWPGPCPGRPPGAWASAPVPAPANAHKGSNVNQRLGS